MTGGFRPRGGVEYREQGGEQVQVYPAQSERPVLADRPDRIVKLTGTGSVSAPRRSA